MIKVLIVDDSPTIREQLSQIIEPDEDLTLAGMAHNGLQAVEMVAKNRPDVIIMDIHMDKMDGFEATSRIMERHPVPIVINSTLLSDDNVENTFRAMQAGAVAALEKPKGPGHPEYKDMCKKLISTVKLMSEVKVVRRSSRLGKDKALDPEKAKAIAALDKKKTTPLKVVAVGASTGGPPVIRTILTNIKKDFNLPILVVQHISQGFLTGMVGWLGKESNLPVKIPKHGSFMEPGCVYFAPDDYHMGVLKSGKIMLSKASLENGVRPSVSYLFNSIVKGFPDNSVGILLSGMGADGAAELREMRDKGALTIAQNKETSVVHGMPGEAIKLKGAGQILAPLAIAGFLNSLEEKENERRK